MNLKQARRLARLAEEAQPPLPMYYEEGIDAKPAADVFAEHAGHDELEVRFLSPNDHLVRFPTRLYIDTDGQLCFWDDEKPDAEALTPCGVTWRMGNPDIARERHMRYFEPQAIEPGTAEPGYLRWIISDDQGDEKPEIEVITDDSDSTEKFMAEMIGWVVEGTLATSELGHDYSYTVGSA